jgi:glycerol-3-phosphate dehydrogenase (NAD(P)+)
MKTKTGSEPIEAKTLTVIGAGSWGSALAHHLGEKGAPVRLWVFEPEVYQDLSETRINRAFLPGFKLSSHISFHREFPEALQGAHVVVMAVPSHVFRLILTRLASAFPEGAILLSAAKGVEIDSRLTMEGVVREVLGPRVAYAALSGPSFAREVMQGQPTAVTIASRRLEVARYLQRLFSSPHFRVYTNYDVIGVELCGALKNIFAIGTGILEGMGLGDNTRAALITRGLAEMTRLGARLGANPLTMTGLAGLGDLVLTCTGRQSRNFQVGLKLGQGENLEHILAGMQMVAEGLKTAQAVHFLAAQLEVEMPIVEAVYRILYEGLTPREAIKKLMTRELKDELEAMTETW